MKNKIPWYTRKQIEHEFYHYEFYKKDLCEIRENVLDSSPPPPDGTPRGNRINKPTEHKVIKMVECTSVLALSKTITAIEETLRSLAADHRKIFSEVYVNGRTDWYALANELHLSYDTFNRKKNELIKTFGHRYGILK
jgi:RinA family phage transcriptional activator